jgi:hypothetical protein
MELKFKKENPEEREQVPEENTEELDNSDMPNSED